MGLQQVYVGEFKLWLTQKLKKKVVSASWSKNVVWMNHMQQIFKDSPWPRLGKESSFCFF
jgi:hypothetical protein